jgi:hypothetical protein
MKKCIILLFAAAGIFAACDIQLDETFDKGSSERLDEHVADVYRRLTAAPNGWVIEYYPHSEQIYGGVNILAKFDKANNVVMINERATDLSATKRSSYTVKRSQGAVLAFDTYNEYISYYADPALEATEGGGGRRWGYLGDLDFAVKTLSDDVIEMKGTKTGNRIVMRKLDSTWEEYLGKVQAMRDNSFYILRYTATSGGQTQTLDIDQRYNTLKYKYQDAANLDVESVNSFMYTDQGIKFYRPLELFGLEMQNFRWDAAASRMLCTDQGAASAFLQAEDTRSYPYFRDYKYFLGEWTFHGASTSGADQVLTLRVVQADSLKTYRVHGFKASNSYGVVEWPVEMSWSRDGRVAILGPQLLGEQEVTRNGVTYPDTPIYMRGSYMNGTLTAANSGMISETTMHETPDRIDFENNGVDERGIGLSIFLNVAGSNLSAGRWLEPMYMVKK